MSAGVGFATDRDSVTAGFISRAVQRGGMVPAKHGETLFLRVDAGAGSGKDPCRALRASRSCVVAMVGDGLDDLSNRFIGSPAIRRAAVQARAIATRGGGGWFVLPNALYGRGLAGSFDDVFSMDRRWVDPGVTGEK